MAQAQRKSQSSFWLEGIDKKPRHSIGAVVDIVKSEFPTLTVSKLRYLEDRGVVCPVRTNSGYRKYSAADIERIRYCLREQRDSFKPLNAIREDIKRLDAGIDIGERPTARVVADAGELVANQQDSLTLTELVDACGVEESDIEALAHAGLLKLNVRGRFSPQAIGVVTLVKELKGVGVEARHLRMLSVAAGRCADLVDQVVNSSSRPHSEQRKEQIQELGELFSSLSQLLVRQAVNEIEA